MLIAVPMMCSTHERVPPPTARRGTWGLAFGRLLSSGRSMGHIQGGLERAEVGVAGVGGAGDRVDARVLAGQHLGAQAGDRRAAAVPRDRVGEIGRASWREGVWSR